MLGMSLRASAALCALAVAAAVALAAPSAPPYDTHRDLTARLRRLTAAHPRLTRLERIGVSRERRELWMLQVAAPSALALERRPGILVVANLAGNDLAGSALAIALAEGLLTRHAGGDADVRSLLETRVFYFIPRLNPDGAERAFRRPLVLDRRNAAPGGDEGRLADLNGDGFITMMRVPDPDGAWKQDEKDPRLLVRAGRLDQGQYHLVPEGDFRRPEAAALRPGVDLNRNFPVNWKMDYQQAGAGPRPVSEAEVRAFLEFANAHPNTYVLHVLQVGTDDPTLPRAQDIPPRGQGTPYDQVYYERLTKKHKELFGNAPRGQQPIPPGPPPVPQFARRGGFFFGRFFGLRTVTVDEERPAGSERYAGTCLDWGYDTHGLLAAAAELWTAPPKPDDAEKKRAEGERGWLEWNDEVLDGEGFLPWTPFEHPHLGPVEIGGWKPFTKDSPPPEVVAEAVEPHLNFLLWRAEQTPLVQLKEVRVEALGGAYYRLRATVTNIGPVATSTGQGVRSRDDRAVFLQLDLTNAEIVVGVRRANAGVIGPGREKTFEWIVRRTAATGRIVVTADSARAGIDRKAVDLR